MWGFEVVGLAAFAYIGWKIYVVDKHNCFLHPHGSTTIAPGNLSSSTTFSTSTVGTTAAGSSTTPFYCFPTVKLLAATSISSESVRLSLMNYAPCVDTESPM